MENNINNEEPCLVPASGQGFSVFYHNRYLYSRYNPEAASVRTAESYTVLPQTLVLVFSPLLGYGLKELIERLPQNCSMILIEADEALFKLSNEHVQKLIKDKPNIYNICIPSGSALFSLFAQKLLPSFSNFKRCLPIELSGGAQLYRQFYHSLTALIDNAINQFWRNRITLVKLGRLYARNIFKNLGMVPFSSALKSNSVSKPIVVCGSGLSLESATAFLQRNSDDCFVIAVDNALMPLLSNGIFPDAIIAVESQLAVEKSYIGSAGTKIAMIADLTSRPHVLNMTGGEISFFISEYEQCNYLERIKNVLGCKVIPPLGSVGLAATEIALMLRKDENVPIFICGLDFSFKPCKTHCKESPSHRTLLNECSRLSPLLRGDAAFGINSYFFAGKDGKPCITTPSLSNYGRTFAARYGRVPNLFDISSEGMELNLERRDLSSAEEIIQNRSEGAASNSSVLQKDAETGENVKQFLLDELEALEKLKFRMINGTELDEIVPALKEREYLYLHFPDGYKEPSLEKSFLNRVRAEIDFFIKDIQFALATIEKNGANS
ncbi:MAG: DUF115 domain-containing protein [Spirochaetaceae bacterium]|nr:DUF115 domain-containing protein [Spirochaetaceae bacterium]